MGFLGKIAAARWLSGGGGGGGGAGPLGLIMIGVMLFALVMLALEAIFSFIYETIRGVLMISPTLSALVVGYGLTLLLLVFTAPHTQEEASEYLSGKEFFLAKTSLAVAATGALFISFQYNVVDAPGESTGIPVVSIVFLFFTFYCMYSLHQSTKLVGALPNGERYQQAIVFPLSFVTVVGVFDLPIHGLLNELVSVWFFLAIPFVIGMVQYRLKPALNTQAPPKEDST